MPCVIDKNKGQKIKVRGTATDVKVIGPLARSDFDYIRESDIASLDLSEAEITEIGNNSVKFLWDNDRYMNSFCESKLKSVVLPKKLKSIKNCAFSGCRSLTSISIPSSVTTIGVYAFGGCASLASVNIPSSVTTIDSYAFYDCSSLVSINIPISVTTIGGSAFYNCSLLASVNIPSSVTTIGEGAFDGCTSLAFINIPSSVTTICKLAFSCCTSLISINIPSSVTTIGGGAFDGCTSLASINIPSSVTTIGNSAFSGCSSLASINIPSSVTTIGDCAFSDCASLTSINIPNSVATTIGKCAFQNCPSGPRRCNMISCECGYCYPEGEPVEHQLIKCECREQVRKCCLKKHKEGSQHHEQKKCSHCAQLYENYQKDQHNITICSCCKTKYCNSQADIHNIICSFCNKEYCAPEKEEHITSTCKYCNMKHCVQQASSHNPVCQHQFFVCNNKAAGCQYKIPIVAPDEIKRQLLQLHLDYFCPDAEIEHDIHKYQLCPFHEKDCCFAAGCYGDPIIARTKIAEHLNSCPYMLTKCKNNECSEYVCRELLSNHMDTCQFTRFKCDYCKGLFHNIRDHIKYECKNTHCENASKGCDFFSTDQAALMKHEMECSNDNIVPTCEFCKEQYRDKMSLKRHCLLECPNNICQRVGCGKRYFTLDALMAHMDQCN